MTIGEFIKKYHRLPKISNPTPECPKELINRKVKQSCRTCKFAPPSKKWPCEDCDMAVYDRWELNDYCSGYAKGYSDGKEQTTENGYLSFTVGKT